MTKKNILLIGASGGLGINILKALNNDYNIAAHFYKNSDDLNRDFKAKTYQADITDENEVINLIREVREDLGSIDILINNAGLSINSVSWKTSLDDWNRVLAVNLTGPFLCTKHVLPIMREQNWGRIIYMSSVVSQTGVPGTVAYASSKSGLLGLCKTCL
ncbi:MAG: SDR family NAD(P)-dependent oxidoreductase, partial [Ignavibacteria bacterium]|nr:SDR family NAD(P)-dependent oxidoreductase [Ignavibacteria bacterium]